MFVSQLTKSNFMTWEHVGDVDVSLYNSLLCHQMEFSFIILHVFAKKKRAPLWKAGRSSLAIEHWPSSHFTDWDITTRIYLLLLKPITIIILLHYYYYYYWKLFSSFIVVCGNPISFILTVDLAEAMNVYFFLCFYSSYDKIPNT